MSQTTDLTRVGKNTGTSCALTWRTQKSLSGMRPLLPEWQRRKRNLVRTGKKSAIVRAYCEMYCTLFDDLFGAGAAQKLFEGRRNARESP